MTLSCPEIKVSVTDHEGVDSVISHINQSGVSFGELSLMYGKPRTATVTCVVGGWLWGLERKAFRGILVDSMSHDNTVKILRKVGKVGQPGESLCNTCYCFVNVIVIVVYCSDTIPSHANICKTMTLSANVMAAFGL